MDGISGAARKKIKISGRVLRKCYNGVARKEGRSSGGGGDKTGERSNRPAAKSRRYGKYRREIRAINTQRPNFVPLPLATVGVVHRSLFYEKKKGNHGKANIFGNILAVCSIES